MSCKIINLEAILAIDVANGLAKNGKMPWKSKTDMTFFKNKTIENIVIMGSNTLLSLPNAQPLPNRTNIVLTNNKEKYSTNYKQCTNLFFLDFEETLNYINIHKNKTIFVIGGNQIYNLLLPYCSTIWLTRMKQNYDCDLIFNYDISTYTKEVIYEDTELEIMYLK